MRTSLWKPNRENLRPFSSIPAFENDDILDDVTLMLDCLRKTDFGEIYAVDLTDPLIPAPVARVIVPGLESWFLHHFSADHCVIGQRARRFLAPDA
jgi:ribosomal protein S12 methylthiotransferase accessory factor